MAEDRQEPQPPAHGGVLAAAAARAHGVSTMFPLSGGHVFPLYDGAVMADPPMRLLDVRHEQTAVFAAEATARLTRSPGLAVLTAGPGVTNGISAITTARFNGSPLVVLAGRAPQAQWGAGSLQELDHVPIVASLTPHRGPTFLDFPLDVVFGSADSDVPAASVPSGRDPDPDDVARAA